MHGMLLTYKCNGKARHMQWDRHGMATHHAWKNHGMVGSCLAGVVTAQFSNLVLHCRATRAGDLCLLIMRMRLSWHVLVVGYSLKRVFCESRLYGTRQTHLIHACVQVYAGQQCSCMMACLQCHCKGYGNSLLLQRRKGEVVSFF